MGISRDVTPEGAELYTRLTFHIPAEAPVKSFSTDELMLIPADPLTVAPFEEQIRTLDKKRLREKMGRVEDDIMQQVDAAIAVSFGLPHERLV